MTYEHVIFGCVVPSTFDLYTSKCTCN